MMAWHQTGTKPLSESMMANFTDTQAAGRQELELEQLEHLRSEIPPPPHDYSY